MAQQRIFVADHKGMVGSAITRLLKNQDVEIITKDRSELDLSFVIINILIITKDKSRC